jgi:subtilase family serine protease
MKGLFNATDRNAPARFLGGASSRRQWVPVTLGAVAAVLFAPCGTSAQSNATIALSPTVAESALLSALDPAQEIRVVLTLPLGDPLGAEEFARRVSDPGDQLYRHYIGPEEFGARYGANVADYQALKAWAAANGLRITQESVARALLTLGGTANQFERLFKTQLNNYRSPDGDEFYSASIAPTIPSAIASIVEGVIGLTESAQHPYHAKVYRILGEHPAKPSNRADTAGGTGPGGTYAPSDLRTAYLIPSFGGFAPQTVALFEAGGFEPSDITTYETQFGLPNVPVEAVSVDGSGTGTNGATIEVVLDIDMVIAINPNVSRVLVYEDAKDNNAKQFSVALVDVMERVASDDLAQTLSISYGLDERQIGTAAIKAENNALLQLASEGITVLVSAGDQGAYGRTGTKFRPAHLNAPDPGSQPFVTSVGGTTLFTYAQEQCLGEEVWNDLGINKTATGGGVSSVWAIPFYQRPRYVSRNGGSTTNRNMPDVAAVGDPLTGVGIFIQAAGGWIQIGGTSVSAPIWGGYISILNSGLTYLTGDRVGFFNPTLYKIQENATTARLYPVLDGSNGNEELYGTPGFNAGRRYNNCTGNGSLFGGGFSFEFLTAETGGAPPGPINNLATAPSSTSVHATWDAVSGATGYALALYVLTSKGQLTHEANTFVTKSNNVIISGLTPGTPYELFVGAVNPTGSSQALTTFTTP